MFCIRTCEDKRKYAYEKAIEAYWKHVDRYHTWMNYYALFNGALFVGFCTLLTATTEVSKNTNDVFELTNNYGILQITLCIVGLISSITWCCSILGHEKWEINWMNIITFYEDIGVYSILISNLKKQPFCKNKNVMTHLIGWKKEIHKKIMKKKYNVADDVTCHTLRNECTFKAFSTHKITCFFVLFVVIGWLIFMIYSFFQYYDIECFPYIFIGIYIISIIYLLVLLFYPKIFYSKIDGKYWINAEYSLDKMETFLSGSYIRKRTNFSKEHFKQ